MNRKGKSTFTKKQHIYLESEYTHSIYFLVEGSVRTYKRHSTKPNNVTCQIIREGNFFGYFEIFSSNTKRLSSACVISKSAVVEQYLVSDFLIKLKEDKDFWFDLYSSMARCESELWNRIIVFREYESYRKIGWMLIKMASPKDDCEDFLEIKYFTHLLLSEYTGSSRQTITSALNHYRKLEVLEYNRKHILIRKSLMNKLIEA